MNKAKKGLDWVQTFAESNIMSPSLITLDAGESVSALHHVGQHHHHPHVVLPDHFPEGWGGVLARTLGSNKLLDRTFSVTERGKYVFKMSGFGEGVKYKTTSVTLLQLLPTVCNY